MSFKLTILGCSSATPTLTRLSSAQVLHVNERLFLIDCGEGAQVEMRRLHIKFQRINHIFISHLHGDHYLGLPGFIFTLHLLGRTNALHIYANKLLKDIINVQLEASNTELRFPLIFHDITPDDCGVIYDDDLVSVTSFPLLHRIPTVGFVFNEKPRPRNIRKDMLSLLAIPIEEFDKIKNGADYTDAEGKRYKNEDITEPPKPPVSYAYCSDTGYDEGNVKYVKNVTLLYHEATFLHDRVSNAREKFHSTCIDAATIAKKAEVKHLMIGHYSARYDDLQPLLDEARSVFPDTVLASDGLNFTIE